jgi:membrane associated rhomboid family serine protease
MELNHLLLLTAVGSSLLIILRSSAAKASRLRIAAGFVLIAAGIGWLLVPRAAGWSAAGAWCALLLLPAYLQRKSYSELGRSRARTAFRLDLSPAVLAVVLANAGMFLVEIIFGGTTDTVALQRLGWLDTDSVIYQHEYWRLLTALFLHYGLLHLFFNLLALAVLGPALEREIGTGRFLVCYLVSGFGSSATVMFLAKVNFLSPVELVGASGCVMGIVGAWAGFLLLHRHVFLAVQRLRNIVVIIVFQLVFDLVTPNVSISAHLGGLVTGFLLGLTMTPQKVRHVIRFR